MSITKLIDELNDNCEYKDDNNYYDLWDQDDFYDMNPAYPLKSYCSKKCNNDDNDENGNGDDTAILCDSCAEILSKYKNINTCQSYHPPGELNMRILTRLDRL